MPGPARVPAALTNGRFPRRWITLIRDNGFIIDALHELFAPPDAPDHPYYMLASDAWGRHMVG